MLARMWQKGEPGWRSGRGQGENAVLQATQQVLGVNGDCAQKASGRAQAWGGDSPQAAGAQRTAALGVRAAFHPRSLRPIAASPTPHGPCAKTSALVIYVSTHRVQQHTRKKSSSPPPPPPPPSCRVPRAQSSLGYSHLCVLEAPLEPEPRRRRKPAPCRGPQHIPERGKKQNVHCVETGPIRY